jgi:single-strand DNA-binding protein
MSDTITLTGLVATTPRTIRTATGLVVTSFRLASNNRRFDREKGRFIDGETNWYTITTFRQLAANTAVCVEKGERVVVSGKLRVRDWKSGDRTGTNIDVEADALGHDLTWGTATFSRSISSSASADPAGPGFPADAAFPAEESFPNDAPSDEDPVGGTAGESGQEGMSVLDQLAAAAAPLNPVDESTPF